MEPFSFNRAESARHFHEALWLHIHNHNHIHIYIYIYIHIYIYIRKT